MTRTQAQEPYPTYEVFNPTDGIPIFTTRYKWLAEFVASCYWRLDFALQGEGWGFEVNS